MDLKELGLVNPEKHWYYQTKLTAILNGIQSTGHPAKTILDVGAGSGFFGSQVGTHFGSTGVICVDPNYDDERLGIDSNGVVPVVYTKSTTEVACDVCLFIDVLEHVEDDFLLLKSYVDIAPSGTLFVISVPAMSSLWSGHDVFLEHFRRYKLKEISNLCERSGLLVRRSTYLFGLIFPFVWTTRKIKKTSAASDLRNSNRTINYILTSILSIEHRFLLNKICGSSALVVCEKS